MPDPVTPTTEAANPWAQFGLNADGTPLVAKPVEKPPEPDTVSRADFAALSTKLEAAEAKIAGMTGLEQKASVVDKLVKALSGDGEDVTRKQYRAVMTDLKEVVRHENPGLYKAIMALETNPDLIDQFGRSVDTLHQGRVEGLNTTAHSRLMEQAGTVFGKGIPQASLEKMIYPYEVAVTNMINKNPELQRQFVSGKVDVVDGIFKELVSPFVAQRLAEKQKRMVASGGPKSPPHGAAEPGATSGANEPAKPNLRDPKQRAAFHKAAVGRFLDRASGDRE